MGLFPFNLEQMRAAASLHQLCMLLPVLQMTQGSASSCFFRCLHSDSLKEKKLKKYLAVLLVVIIFQRR